MKKEITANLNYIRMLIITIIFLHIIIEDLTGPKGNKYMGAIGIALFGSFGLWTLYRLFFNYVPALIINENGVFFSAQIGVSRWIAWNEIHSITFEKNSYAYAFGDKAPPEFIIKTFDKTYQVSTFLLDIKPQDLFWSIIHSGFYKGELISEVSFSKSDDLLSSLLKATITAVLIYFFLLSPLFLEKSVPRQAWLLFTFCYLITAATVAYLLMDWYFWKPDYYVKNKFPFRYFLVNILIVLILSLLTYSILLNIIGLKKAMSLTLFAWVAINSLITRFFRPLLGLRNVQEVLLDNNYNKGEKDAKRN